MVHDDKMQKIIEVEEKLNEVLPDLLGNLYMLKSVDERTVDKFFSILRQVKLLFEDEKLVPKRLTATLLRTYFIIDGEAMNATPDQQVSLMRLLGETQGFLSSIFEDNSNSQ